MPNRDEERAKRLAAALRDNLRRRKAQARALSESSASQDKPEREGPDGG